ncbi:hypothetical protein B5807_00942 [Epicoccum nigrum]|uniref:Uncharacterized protein n=1 Tax=Epicoccum nigrum TaxID=105696 RepID=A0A1Y2MFJ0_EPING|nr:hypothetical protein B5807_00942 [Epicoccum nigrum]
MTTPSPTPTTTYPFRLFTYTNASPSPPSSYPTTYTDTTWLPPTSAGTACASATQYPRLQGPLGLQAGCVISNAEEVNKNAFWDMYACCPGHGIEAYGYSFSAGEEESEAGICMVQCRIEDEESTTWQQVGECLQKRVKEAVCAPRYEERYSDDAEMGSSSVLGTGTASSSVAASSGAETGSAGAIASASTSTGAASRGVVHVGSVKVGLFTFGLLALGSAAGMFL